MGSVLDNLGTPPEITALWIAATICLSLLAFVLVWRMIEDGRTRIIWFALLIFLPILSPLVVILYASLLRLKQRNRKRKG